MQFICTEEHEKLFMKNGKRKKKRKRKKGKKRKENKQIKGTVNWGLSYVFMYVGGVRFFTLLDISIL